MQATLFLTWQIDTFISFERQISMIGEGLKKG